MRFFFIRLLSEGSCSEDHARDRQAGVTEFRELHKDSLTPGRNGLFCPQIINDDTHH